MSNISKIKIKNADGTEKEYSVSDSDIGTKIGNLEELTTEDKSSIVNAINEVVNKDDNEGGSTPCVEILYNGGLTDSNGTLYTSHSLSKPYTNYDVIICQIIRSSSYTGYSGILICYPKNNILTNVLDIGNSNSGQPKTIGITLSEDTKAATSTENVTFGKWQSIRIFGILL